MMPGFSAGNTCGHCVHVPNAGNEFSAAIELPLTSFLVFHVILGNRLVTFPEKIEFPPLVSSLPAQSAHYGGLFS
jgi:hypothetical protein